MGCSLPLRQTSFVSYCVSFGLFFFSFELFVLRLLMIETLSKSPQFSKMGIKLKLKFIKTLSGSLQKIN